MKSLKVIIAVAVFSFGLFVSCTPESIQDEKAPNQIDVRTVKVPPAG